MQSVRISVRVDSKIQQRLREEAKKAGKNESDLVREALVMYLAKCLDGQSALEAARRAGVVGCAKGLPRDLSVNKKHFEGFGQ